MPKPLSHPVNCCFSLESKKKNQLPNSCAITCLSRKENRAFLDEKQDGKGGCPPTIMGLEGNTVFVAATR